MLLIGIIYWRIPKYIKTFYMRKTENNLHDFKLNKEYGMKTEIFEGKIKCCNSVAYTKDS